MDKEFHCSVPALQGFMARIIEAAGAPAEDADIASRNMMQAELWGVRTHGISRLSRYVMRLENGTVKAHPHIKINRTYASAITVDGDNGLGSVVMEKALMSAMENAAQTGLCVVGVKASNHFGMAGYYAYLAAKKGFLSIGFTNSLAAMAPWGGRTACLGTNPIAFGFPRSRKKPIFADLATSLVARGKILLAAKTGKRIPSDWALNAAGIPTTDPHEAANGLLLPLGGPKGYALALSADILSGVFSGADFLSLVGSYVKGRSAAGIGHFYLVMRSDLFLSAEAYQERIEQFVAELISQACQEGVERIYLPGEREQMLEEKQRKNGLTLPSAIYEELAACSEQYHIPLP